ncbi:hypothetical protein CEXT_667901 [Caerostris extrusa]|uniref:Uncharacterized protein n=1 Tax=Caerostris extrusa TaxID=172846 RepID=A0AAV4SEK9_CAEEX|nr:hypothetical protein CEXT_667901 [Caerostris extrusa]
MNYSPPPPHIFGFRKLGREIHHFSYLPCDMDLGGRGFREKALRGVCRGRGLWQGLRTMEFSFLLREKFALKPKVENLCAFLLLLDWLFLLVHFLVIEACINWKDVLQRN